MEKIEARIILEIMGRPPEHVKETLAGLIEKLGAEKGVSVTNKIIHEPVRIKDSKDLYTTFCEIELTFDSFAVCTGVVFGYMPSNLEIISPKSFKMTNDEVNFFMNTLAAKLHNYEAITKRLIVDRDILINKLKYVMEGKGKVEVEEKPMVPLIGKDNIKKKTGKKSKKK